MKFKVETLGCKVNSYESEYITNLLISNNYLLSNDKDLDLIIINTCSVTNEADNKSLKTVRSYRRKYPNAIILVCGCSSENEPDRFVEAGANIIIGTYYKSEVLELISEYQKEKKVIKKFNQELAIPFEDMFISNITDKTRAFVKIQDGCNNYCSYCVIPYLRKNTRSKDFDLCLKEIKALVDNGFKEIVLTGIHTGSYFSSGKDLTDLIHEISKIEGLERIRISSIEITELDHKFIEEFKNNPKICSHLHVPLQAGSDHILKLMNRKYNLSEFENIIAEIRKVRPSVNLTTDIIVGFPGETKDDFLSTLEFAQKINFSKIHVFPYSVRKRTVAEKLPNHVSPETKKCRVKELIALSDELNYQYNEGYLGKKVDVLIETNGTYSVGHTEFYLKVKVNANLEKNKNYTVIIKKTYPDYVEGELIS